MQFDNVYEMMEHLVNVLSDEAGTLEGGDESDIEIASLLIEAQNYMGLAMDADEDRWAQLRDHS